MPQSRSLDTQREPARNKRRTFEEWQALHSRLESTAGTAAREDSSDAAARPRRRSSLDSFEIDWGSTEFGRRKAPQKAGVRGSTVVKYMTVLGGLRIGGMSLYRWVWSIERAAGKLLVMMGRRNGTGGRERVKKKTTDRGNITVRIPEEGYLIIIDDVGRVQV